MKIMEEIYHGYDPSKVLAKVRETSSQESKYPDPWAEWGTTEEDLDRNVEPEIRIKDTVDVLEKGRDGQGCMGASNLLGKLGIYRDPHKPRDYYELR